jgi:hypothetical protein
MLQNFSKITFPAKRRNLKLDLALNRCFSDKNIIAARMHVQDERVLIRQRQKKNVRSVSNYIRALISISMNSDPSPQQLHGARTKIRCCRERKTQTLKIPFAQDKSSIALYLLDHVIRISLAVFCL